MSSSLADIVKSLRSSRGVSLRKVERETGVSNAYLSQIESGTARRPSPDKLYALAEYFEVPYGDLMRAAGHVTPAEEGERTRGRLELALMSMDLSPDEEEQVLRYVSRVLRDP